jgi:predicted nucleotidyltransferase
MMTGWSLFFAIVVDLLDELLVRLRLRRHGAYGVTHWRWHRCAMRVDVVPFTDGELGTARADTFRTHLANCARCRHDVAEAVLLSVRLSKLGSRR